MTEYSRGSLCRLARRIEDNTEYAKRIGISIEWKKNDILPTQISEKVKKS
jgi:hypothetical protein